MLARLKSDSLAHVTPFLWLVLCLLLVLGIATTIGDLAALPKAQTRHANETQQRVIIDPVTGLVSGLKSADAKEEHPFDVAATPAPKPEPAAAAPAPVVIDPLPSDLETLREAMPEINSSPVPLNPNSLTTVPAPEITEKFPDGTLLPKRGDKGAAPMGVYTQPFTRVVGQSRLTIVLLDVGLNPEATAQLVTLPKQVTLAVSPYMHNAAPTLERLRNTGFEIWTMLPTMSEHYPLDDPGPLGMISTLPTDELLRRLHHAMAATLGSVGFVLAPNDGFTSKKESFAAVLKEIDARGMATLSTHPTRSIEQLSGDETLRATIRRADMVLDDTPNDALIRSKLAALIPTLDKQGDTVLIASARPQTISILADWLKATKLPASVVLAPLSAVYGEDPAEVQSVAAKAAGGGAEAAKEAAKPTKTEKH